MRFKVMTLSDAEIDVDRRGGKFETALMHGAALEVPRAHA
jgi:hypothetical protein